MSRRTIQWLVVFSALSIIGVLITQIYWVKRIVEIRNREFSQQAHVALQDVAEELASVSNVMLQNNPVEQLSPDYFLINTNARTQPDILEHYLREAFTKQNIVTDFEIGIYDCNTNAMQYGMMLSTKNQDKIPTTTAHWLKTDKYPYYVGIRFPSQTASLPWELEGWMWSSFLIIVALGFFAYALFVILRQKQLSDEQKDFINNMTHELQTPISSIRIASDVLANPAIVSQPDRYNRYVNLVKEEIGRLQRQVELVLTTAKAERNMLDIREEVIDAHEEIRSVLVRYRGQVSHDFSATNATILADRDHFHGMIGNLVDNAVKYSGAEPDVRISTTNIGKKLSIDISDKGIGISPEQQKKIFDKFYRVPSGDIHNAKGFGIGLSYVKEIVRAHGWKLELSSSPGKGSRFRILANLR
ncbi:HAMP domain-containing sensor histidine kinase [Ravibacter arvi]|uniref:histidine kinase n=1 Tax=Ravibacter arvi TaxID=2051041 RepID=A0ABP8M9W0_9BACT